MLIPSPLMGGLFYGKEGGGGRGDSTPYSVAADF